MGVLRRRRQSGCDMGRRGFGSAWWQRQGRATDRDWRAFCKPPFWLSISANFFPALADPALRLFDIVAAAELG